MTTWPTHPRRAEERERVERAVSLAERAVYSGDRLIALIKQALHDHEHHGGLLPDTVVAMEFVARGDGDAAPLKSVAEQLQEGE